MAFLDFGKAFSYSSRRLLQLYGREATLQELSAETERRFIQMRYFQEKTQVEVAKALGISQVQVSRMEKRILLRLRQEAG